MKEKDVLSEQLKKISESINEISLKENMSGNALYTILNAIYTDLSARFIVNVAHKNPNTSVEKLIESVIKEYAMSLTFALKEYGLKIEPDLSKKILTTDG